MATPSGGITTDDLKRMGEFWWKYSLAELPGRIAADPRLSQLQKAAQANGIDFMTVMRNVPVNRSGTVLSSATSFLQQYGEKLNPATIGQIKPTTSELKITPMSAQDFGAKAWSYYKGLSWPQIRARLQTDPWLQEFKRAAESVGQDWETALKSAATDGNAKLAAVYSPTAAANQPAVNNQKMLDATTKQQLVAPVGPNPNLTMGAVTPKAPVTPTGTPQSPITGAPKTPVNVPAVQTVTPADTAKTGVSIVDDGNKLQTSGATPATAATPKPVTAPAAQQTTVDLREGLNQFYPELVKNNLEELQLARLPVGQLVAQEQANLRNLGNQPKADVMSQNEAMLQSPHKIRQQALERFRAGTLTPVM